MFVLSLSESALSGKEGYFASPGALVVEFYGSKIIHRLLIISF